MTMNDPLLDGLKRGLDCFLDPHTGLIQTQQRPISVLTWRRDFILVDVFAVSPTIPPVGFELTQYGLN